MLSQPTTKRSTKLLLNFRRIRSIFWKITFPAESNKWKEASCTCPSYDKFFMCKHIISIANSLGLITNDTPVDEDYDDEPFFQLGRGRPKRMSKALVLDNA